MFGEYSMKVLIDAVHQVELFFIRGGHARLASVIPGIPEMLTAMSDRVLLGEKIAQGANGFADVQGERVLIHPDSFIHCSNGLDEIIAEYEGLQGVSQGPVD